MSSRIKSLTSEQIAAMPRYVEEWTRIGLCTDPADRPAAEAGIRLAYEAAGLPSPRIVWTGSPLGNAIAEDGIDGYPQFPVWDSFRASVRAEVENSVVDSVWDLVTTLISGLVAGSVGKVGELVMASTKDQAPADSVGSSLFGGQYQAIWLSAYDFYRHECGLQHHTDRLQGLTQIARSAGWLNPCSDVCFISERHNVLNLDRLGLLHCETGPAVAYPDGFSTYAWHGVRVPEAVIMRPETITPEAIAAERNAEVRRCMVERVGHERAIEMLGAREVQRDECGRLLRADGHAWVEVVNGTEEPDGTRKRYLLKVPTRFRTARGAVAWTYGFYEARSYKVDVRT